MVGLVAVRMRIGVRAEAAALARARALAIRALAALAILAARARANEGGSRRALRGLPLPPIAPPPIALAALSALTSALARLMFAVLAPPAALTNSPTVVRTEMKEFVWSNETSDGSGRSLTMRSVLMGLGFGGVRDTTGACVSLTYGNHCAIGSQSA